MQIIRQKNTAFESYSKKSDMCYISYTSRMYKITSIIQTSQCTYEGPKRCPDTEL